MTVGYLADKHKKDLDIRWYDVSRSPERERFRDFVVLANDRRWPYPITIVNDEVRLIGGIDYYSLDRLIGDGIADARSRKNEPRPAGAV